MSGLYENVRRDQKAKKDMGLYVTAAVAVCLLAAAVYAAVWFFGCQKRFAKFVSNLSASTTYAYNNDCLTAKTDGTTFPVSAEDMYGIFTCLSLNKPQKESGKAPEGEPLILDYGDGAVLKLWAMPAKDGRADLFVQYTDAEGNVYSYISDKITLETIVTRYLTYGKEEIE